MLKPVPPQWRQPGLQLVAEKAGSKTVEDLPAQVEITTDRDP
jgi:hypothetical protein